VSGARVQVETLPLFYTPLCGSAVPGYIRDGERGRGARAPTCLLSLSGVLCTPRRLDNLDFEPLYPMLRSPGAVLAGDGTGRDPSSCWRRSTASRADRVAG